RTKVGSAGRSVVTDALERHVDEGAVVGLERDAQVELDHAVRALDRPIVAAWQHLATKPVTLERASGDRKRDAHAVGPGADILRGCRVQSKCNQGTRSHGNFPVSRS